MGAGMSALSKVRELQELGNKDAMAQLLAVDVPKAHAKTVLKRIRAMQTIDAQTVAELVDGLPGETQDALVLLSRAGPGAPDSPSKTPRPDWGSQKEALLQEGWSEPLQEFDDGPSLIGYRVFVEGLGKGKVTAFTRAKFGPSAHTVEFPGIVPGAASSTRQVKLRRKGNGETPWVVQLPTRVVVQESPEHEASAARDARLALLGGRRGIGATLSPERGIGITLLTEPEPEPEQEPARPRPRTPPWAQWWKENEEARSQQQQQRQQQQQQYLGSQRSSYRQHRRPPQGADRLSGLSQAVEGMTTFEEALDRAADKLERACSGEESESESPGGPRQQQASPSKEVRVRAQYVHSNSLTGGGKLMKQVSPARRPAYPTAIDDSLPPWSVDGDGEASSMVSEVSGYSYGVEELSGNGRGRGGMWSGGARATPPDGRTPDMPPLTPRDDAAAATVDTVSEGLQTVQSVSSGSDEVKYQSLSSDGEVQYASFGSAPSDWTDASMRGASPATIRGGVHNTRSIAESLEEGGEDPAEQPGLSGSGWGKPLAPGAQVRPAQIAPAMPGSEAPASLRVQPGRWKKGQLLGTGSFGSVYKGLNLDTGAMIAVKVLLVPTCVHNQLGPHDT